MRPISAPCLRHMVLAMLAVSTALLVVFASAATAAAATLTVTTEADEGGSAGNTGACSLREAITALNNGANGSGCTNSSGDGFGTNDRIEFNIPTGTMANQIGIRLFTSLPLETLDRRSLATRVQAIGRAGTESPA